MFSNITRKALIAPALLLTAGCLFAAPPKASTESASGVAIVTFVTVTPEYLAANEASSLLKQIQQETVQLSKNGDTLASFARSGVSRDSYSAYLDMVKQNINQTGANLARLEEIKANAAPWQRQAIDKLTPLARQVASSTEAAIIHLNENPNHLFSPAYVQNLNAIANGAAEMKSSVNGFLNIAATNQKADGLRDKADQLQMKANDLQMKLAGANS